MNKEVYYKEGLDLKRLGLFFQKKIWVVLLMAVLGGCLGAVGFQVVKSIKMPIEYEAVSKLYITFGTDDNGDVYQYYNGYTWNELIHSNPMMTMIMGYLIDYDEEEVKEAISAEIISDIRLLTVTVKGNNEKTVREIQHAVENGLAAYATVSEELSGITTIRTITPERVYWSDRTKASMIFGAIVFGVLTLLIFVYAYVMDEGIYVQSDLEKRYSYKALGVMPRNQKGLQPYLSELKANILYALLDNRTLSFVDIDNHAELRAQDLEKILNWEEAGALGGVENISGELVWHVNDEPEDDLFDEPKDAEWTIVPMNSDLMDAEKCEYLRKDKGVIILVPFGSSSAPRKLERTISLLENQDVDILGIVITEADEEYLNRYYS